VLTSEAISPDKVKTKQEVEFISIGKAVAAEIRGDLVIVQGEKGTLALQNVSKGIVRVKLFIGEQLTESLDMSTTVAIVQKDPKQASDAGITESDTTFIWEIEDVRIEISKANGGVSFIENGKVTAKHAPLQWDTNLGVIGVFQTSLKAHYYGLGEKTGFLDKRGERYEMWNTDVFAPHVQEIVALYQSIPFIIVHESTNTYGLFLDNPGRSHFDMRSDAEAITIQTETGDFDYYYISGPMLKDVVGRYTTLTGRMPLPPQWALGYHQSRYSYMNQEEVLELARTFREKNIPCDVIYLDIHYMDGYRVFTFDPVRFPNPKEMMAALKEMGIRVVPIVDPGVKVDGNYSIYTDGTKANYFCKNQEGVPFMGPVWPGISVFPDFTEDEVSQWWGDLHRFYTEMGIEGIWNDMNEPAVFNESKTMDVDTLHGNNGNPVTHGEVHNLYGLLMSKATSEGLKRNLDGHRPFVLTRAGYAGIQRYAAVWTGDNRSFWEHMALAMPMVLNLGLSGIPFSGSDIGGFAHHTSGELLARWTQMGALFPYCRNHSEQSSIRQEPWQFGPEVENICREYIELRYKWLPFLYSLFRESAETGLPIIRPLVLEFPEDPNVTNLCDQFLLGDSVIVAPVYRPNTDHRAVYLPAGTWYDYWTGEKYEGNRHILAYAPLEKLPLYVKVGMILPHHTDAVSSTLSEAPEELQLTVYCSGSANGEFELYEDDGVTFAYEQGEFNAFNILMEETEAGLSLEINPTNLGFESNWKTWTIQFKHLPLKNYDIEDYPVASNKNELKRLDNGWYYETETGELTIKLSSPIEKLVRVRVNHLK
jgi:alpha-glucosidase